MSKASSSYPLVARHWNKRGEVLEVVLEIATVELDGRQYSMTVLTDVTGIAQAERRFRLLVENSNDAIALTTADGVLEYVSPAGERILGYSAKDISGAPYRHRLHPDDVDRQPMPKPGETIHYVIRVLHRDGTWRWIETSTTNLTHEPAVRAFVSNYRDITQRKLAERAMEESQRRLEYLLSATSSITYSARPDGDYGATFISANVQDVLDYSPEQFCSDPGFWLTNIHPDDRPAVDTHIAGLFEKGTQSVEYRFRHADGSYRWMRDVARIVRDDAGAPIEVVGYWLDITDQNRAVASLRRSEANFRSLIELSPTATFVYRAGHYVYVNAAAVALCGYETAADLIGRSVLELVHPDDRDPVRARMQEALETGVFPPIEARVVRRDGSVFLGEGEGLMLDFDGEPSQVILARDVTERSEMFARMAMADRMLTVGTLAAGVAHEINNPLAYVAANLETLARELPGLLAHAHGRTARADLSGLVADARDGVARVSTIVGDLRALARPDDDVRGPVDVARVLASSIKMAHNELRHRARIVENYEPDLPPVQANASRLGQVFLNLLLNAAQAMAVGRADQNQLRVHAAASPVGDHVRVEIEDTGVGIPTSIIRRIFDPFFTTKAPGGGMGLGLAISHQIVRELDGQITVTSRPGHGSTFRVVLPVAAAQPKVDAPAVAPARTLDARVLFVDDEEAVGRSVRALLEEDHDVVAVTKASAALDLLAAGERFDVIVCDLMMPEITGIEFYERLTAADQQRTIFVTGGAFTTHAREFLVRSERPTLDKPFSEHGIRSAIERIVARRPTTS
jgi:PAS domain S-box-containing protein